MPLRGYRGDVIEPFARAECLILNSLENGIVARWVAPQELERPCQMTRAEELPRTTNSPHTRAVLPPRITGKKITRPDTSIPNKH